METERELGSGTCCLCLSEDESTFNSNSIMKSLPLHEMVNFCIGIQINGENDRHQPFSTSICNECVLNINNFYTFKKKILDAQELINTLSLDKQKESDPIGDPILEYVEEDMLQMIETNEQDQQLQVNNERSIETSKTIQIIDQQIISVQPIIKSVKRRTNEQNNQNVTNKKQTKIDTNFTEKVIIQMNECLICPSILGDIIELKDHIETHTEIKCKACKRDFARYSNLKRHFNSTHSKPKPFQCDICSLGFNFSVNLQAHAELHYAGKIRNE